MEAIGICLGNCSKHTRAGNWYAWNFFAYQVTYELTKHQFPHSFDKKFLWLFMDYREINFLRSPVEVINKFGDNDSKKKRQNKQNKIDRYQAKLHER